MNEQIKIDVAEIYEQRPCNCSQQEDQSVSEFAKNLIDYAGYIYSKQLHVALIKYIKEQEA